MGQPVIEVEGHFGPKEITQQDFISTWTSHVRELKRLDYDMEWTMKIDEVIELVEQKANQEFRAMFKRQHGVDLDDYRQPTS